MSMARPAASITPVRVSGGAVLGPPENPSTGSRRARFHLLRQGLQPGVARAVLVLRPGPPRRRKAGHPRRRGSGESRRWEPGLMEGLFHDQGSDRELHAPGDPGRALEDGVVSELFIEREAHRGHRRQHLQRSGDPGAARDAVGVRGPGAGARRLSATWPTLFEERGREGLRSTPEERATPRPAPHSATRPSRNACTRARTCWCRWSRSRWAPREPASPPTSRCPGAIWCSCRRSSTWASRARSWTDDERRRLKTLLKEIRQERGGGGFIARTAGAGTAAGRTSSGTPTT